MIKLCKNCSTSNNSRAINALELQADDLEATHLWLTSKGVPNLKGGEELSLVERIMSYIESEVELTETQRKSLELMDPYFDTITDQQFLANYHKVETNPGITVKDYLKDSNIKRI